MRNSMSRSTRKMSRSTRRCPSHFLRKPAACVIRLTSVLLIGGALAMTGGAGPRPALAQSEAQRQAQPQFTADDIEAAEYAGGDLPSGQSALTAKVQVLLDRAGISPGVVDGWRGGMSESAIKAFQRRAGLPMDGRLNPVVWQLLQAFADGPLTMEYTITDDDAHGLVDRIPEDYAEKARMTSQGYTSVQEKLAERFHMDERFLARLNPGAQFIPGETIRATVPARPIRAKVTRIVVDKEARRVAAYDAKGRMVADYPATVGSDQTPSPRGTHVVRTVALNPTYTYNPQRNFQQGDNDRVLIIPPGPNGPVGDVWIDLSEPTYGIHGTATPSRLFVNQSNGCVRLTNWDARELAGMVQAGVTQVEFLDPGVSIADVTGPAASAAPAATLAVAISATRPTARPRLIAQADQPETVAADALLVTPAALDGAQQGQPGAPTVAGSDPLASAIADAIGTEPQGQPLPANGLPAAGQAPSGQPAAVNPPAISATAPPRRRPADPAPAGAPAAAPAVQPPAPAQTADAVTATTLPPAPEAAPQNPATTPATAPLLTTAPLAGH